MAALHTCLSVHDVKEALEQFPARIEDVYCHTWKRIVDQGSKSGFGAQNFIIWVLNSPKSLTVHELRRAAATSLETHKLESDRLVDQDMLLSICHGLLVVDEQTELVRLVRRSLPRLL